MLTRTDSDTSYGFLFLVQSTQSIDKGSTYYHIQLESYSRWKKEIEPSSQLTSYQFLIHVKIILLIY